MSSKKFGDLLTRYSGVKRNAEEIKDVEQECNFGDQFVGYVILKLTAGLMLDINQLLVKESLENVLRSNRETSIELNIRLHSFTSTIMIHFTTLKSIQETFKFFRSEQQLQLAGESGKMCQLYLHKVYLYHKPNILDELATPSHHLTKLPVHKKAIVISRYNETIKWIPHYWYENIYFYNKEENESASKTLHTELTEKHVHHFAQLTNVGRESHTYLTFILDHYDSLPQIIYFTQASPFDHCPDFVRLVDANVGIVNGFTMLGKRILTVKHGDVREYERNFPGIQVGFDRTFQQLFGEVTLPPQPRHTMPPPREIQFTPGAIFAVHRELILLRSRAFYQQALSLLEYDKNPIEGHSLERLWKLIFSAYS